VLGCSQRPNCPFGLVARHDVLEVSARPAN
jgi:hypothetical protein